MRSFGLLLALAVAALAVPDAGPAPLSEPIPAPISEPDGGPLQALHERLARWRGGDGGALRIVQVGDSHTEAGYLPQALAALLAEGKPVVPGLVWPGYLSATDVVLKTNGRTFWKQESWLEAKATGPFGPRGAAWVARRAGATLAFSAEETLPEQTRLVVRYAPFRPPRTVEVWAGGERVAALPAAEETAGTVASFELPWPASGALELRVGGAGAGEFRLYGASVQRPDAAVVYDALGTVGTTAEAPLRRDDGALLDYLRQARPDLLIVWYGSNSAVTPRLDVDGFVQPFDALLSRLQSAAGGAPVLLLGLPDLDRRPEGCGHWVWAKRRHRPADALRTFVCDPERAVQRSKGKVVYPAEKVASEAQWVDWQERCALRTLGTVDPITQLEQGLADAHGALFFDTFAAMGGEGSILAWACLEPRLAEFDLVHLSRAGHARLAAMIVEEFELTRR